MSSKKLFETAYKTTQFHDYRTRKEAFENVESYKNAEQLYQKIHSFEPQIDYTDPANFAKYGSAYFYYKGALDRVTNFYPYDGSQFEKNKFYNELLPVEKFIFNYKYPVSTGYGIISSNGWGTRDGGLDSGFGTPIDSNLEYITFKGGPNTGSSGTSLVSQSPDDASDYRNYGNRYQDSGSLYSEEGLPIDYGKSTRLSNLRSNFNDGVTVEFWLKTGSLDPATTTQKQVLFDMWNNETPASTNNKYGRITLLLDSTATKPFTFTVESGSTTKTSTIGSAGMHITLSDWKHYAVTFYNTGSDFVTKFYVNGALDETVTTAGTLNEINSKNLMGRIGALLTSTSASAGGPGAGKLSGSVDEFRFWKVARNSKQIAENWFSHVGGGANTDVYTGDIGLYFKFNEGITNSSSVDSIVLDYGGRVSNGFWHGYHSKSRNTGSALVSSSATHKELADPVIRTDHPRYKSLEKALLETGSHYDSTNNSSFISYTPSWIIEQHEDLGNDNLKIISHIVGSYLDTIRLQASAIPEFKFLNHTSASVTPLPFANHLPQSLGLDMPDIFMDSTLRELLQNRNNKEYLQGDLTHTKNLIYQNIYNNLTDVYKSKGTEKSFRNILRAFNIDDDLVRIKVYSNNEIYEAKNNTRQVIKENSAINFDKHAHVQAVVYQRKDTTNPNSSGFISGSYVNKLAPARPTYEAPYGFTAEADVVFPKFFKSRTNFDRTFTNVSLFGIATVETASSDYLDGINTTVPIDDKAGFQVSAIREEENSKNVYFKLESSNNPYALPVLTSSMFYDVYDNQRWNLSVRIKPKNFPFSGFVTGALSYKYDVIFRGVTYNLGVITNQFSVSSSLSFETGSSMATSAKRVWAGAYRENVTGSLLSKTDVLMSNVKYWTKFISDSVLDQHVLDIDNSGISGSYKNISGLDRRSDQYDLTNQKTLALEWNFDSLTGSSAAGTFSTIDFSSGSALERENNGWLGKISRYQHSGHGEGFEVSSKSCIKTKRANSFKFIDPEENISADMVQILSEDETFFDRSETIPNYLFTVEKSMYQAISEEMLIFLAGVIDFNNIIGEPVNRYRSRYKSMEKLRSAFFRRVNNVKDVEKFVGYYRWFDEAISSIFEQLVPASMDFIPDITNTIESHVLERNKYDTKFPTLEFNVPDPTATCYGASEITYAVAVGTPTLPSSPRNTRKHTKWWKDRAERTAAEITSGDEIIDSVREKIRRIVVSHPTMTSSNPILVAPGGVRHRVSEFKRRGMTSTALINADAPNNKTIKGGVNFEQDKNIQFTYTALGIHGPVRTTDGVYVPQNILFAPVSEFTKITQFLDPTNPINKKIKRNVGVVHGREHEEGTKNYSFTKSSKAFPFNIISSSVSGGYQTEVQNALGLSLEITNLHNDVYGPDMEKPLQGPFTEYAVGGHQSRHVPVNYASSTKNLDNSITRPEAWRILLGACNPIYSGAIGMVGADYPEPTTALSGRQAYPYQEHKRATYYRDLTAKSPINIRNIKITSSSPTVLGNFRQNYEIVHTFGAHSNPRQFIENPPTFRSSSFQNRATSSTSIRTFLDTKVNREYNAPLDRHEFAGEYDVSYLTTSTNKSVIKTKFSAPGGIEVSTPGYTDFRSDEFSVYNAIPFRNLSVLKHSQGPTNMVYENRGIRVADIHDRDYGLRSHLARHTAKFGRDSLMFADRSERLRGERKYDLTKPFVAYENGRAYRQYTAEALQAWWRLNKDISDATAGNALDSSGNDRNGTFSTPSVRPAFSKTLYPSEFVQSGSCTFDGGGTADDSTSVGTAATWDAIIGNDTGGGSTEKMTFAAWIYKTGDGENNFGRILDFGNSDIMWYTGTTEKVYFAAKWNGANTVQWATTDSVFSLNEWTHVVITYDATAAANDPKVYVNGVEKSVVLDSGVQTGAYYGIVSQDAHIGNRSGGDRTFEGQLADVAVWNSILSSEEIGALFDSSKTIEKHGPGAIYKQKPGFHKIHRNNLDKPKPIYGTRKLYKLNQLHGQNHLHFLDRATVGDANVLFIPDRDVSDAVNLRKARIFDGNYAENILHPIKEGRVEYSISMWFRGYPTWAQEFMNLGWTGTNAVHLFSRRSGAGAGNFRYQLRVTGAAYPSLGGATVNWTTTTTPMTSSAWTHMLFTFSGVQGDLYNNVTASVYFNGEPHSIQPDGGLISTVDSIESGSTTFNNFRQWASIDLEAPITIGGPIDYTATNARWTGSIDEISMWDKELTAADAVKYYNNGAPVNLTSSDDTNLGSLLSWWRMGDAPTDNTSISGSAPVDPYTLPTAGNNVIHDVKGGATLFLTNRDPISFPDSKISVGIESQGYLTGGATYRADDYAIVGFMSASEYDNFNVSHAIPRSSKQYAWITGALDSTNGWTGFVPKDFKISSSVGYVNAYSFISASDYGSYRASGQTYYGMAKSGENATFAEFLPVDFVGLNTIIYEPMTSSANILGYPNSVKLPGGNGTEAINKSNGFYLNVDYLDRVADKTLPRVGQPAILNAILLNRNGPYGYPMWKQLRQATHPILRTERATNKISVAKEDNSGVEHYDFIPCSLRGRPVEVSFGHTSSVDGNMTDVVAQTTHKTSPYFSSAGLTNKLFPRIPEKFSDFEILYTSLITNPEINNINYIKYSENVYPATRNEFSTRSTDRAGYDNGFWKNNRYSRNIVGAVLDRNYFPTTNPQLYAGSYTRLSSFGFAMSSSAWHLDAPTNLQTRRFPPELKWDNHARDIGVLWRASGSSGELQNTAMSYFTGSYIFNHDVTKTGSTHIERLNSITPGALYARKHMHSSPMSLTSPYGVTNRRLVRITPKAADGRELGVKLITNPRDHNNYATGYSGESLWEAGVNAGISVYDANADSGNFRFVLKPSKPAYDTYEKFNNSARLKTRGFSVVPEFRISNHVDDYIKAGKTLIEGKFDTFDIPGTSISSSQDNFYKDYSNTEFMKEFSTIKEMTGMAPGEMRLVVSASIKFHPYKGFYPQERSLQLVEKFKKEYIDQMSVTIKKRLADGTGVDSRPNDGGVQFVGEDILQNAAGAIRPLCQAMFAPGILYNSIKSGIAVDYPVITERSKVIAGGLQTVSASSVCNDAVLTIRGATVLTPPPPLFYGSGSFFDRRIPFEAIINPELTRMSTFVDIEPHLSASLETVSASAGNVRWEHPQTSSVITNFAPSQNRAYTLMARNFFGGVADFYLKDSTYTKLESSVIPDTMKFSEGEVYMARLKIRRSVTGSRVYNFESASFDDLAYNQLGARAYHRDAISVVAPGTPQGRSYVQGNAYFELPQDPMYAPGFEETFTMYSRPTAFGPPIGGVRDLPLNTAADSVVSASVVYNSKANFFTSGSYQIMDSRTGFNWAYTPPYYNGESWVDMVFRPTASVTYDLERILAETKTACWRVDSGPKVWTYGPHGVPVTAIAGSRFLPFEVPDPNLIGYPTVASLAAAAAGPKFSSLIHDPHAIGTNIKCPTSIYGGTLINDSAMQLTSSVEIFGIKSIPKITVDPVTNQTVASETEVVGKKWVIGSKFETPMLNFNDKHGIRPVTASLGTKSIFKLGSTTETMYGDEAAANGMWHQFGTIPTDSNTGVFLELDDISSNWLERHYLVRNSGSIYNDNVIDEFGTLHKKVKSLKDLCKFDQNNQSKRMGELKDSLTVKEAIIAVPYMTDIVERPNGLVSTTTSGKFFFQLPISQVDASLDSLINTPIGQSIEFSGQSIRNQINLMQEYVLPPQLDFITNRELTPVVMYIFEFTHTFDKDDLSYMWQNLMPRNYDKFDIKGSSVSHMLANNELFDEIDLFGENSGQIRWQVFKAKQKIQSNYYDKRPSPTAVSTLAQAQTDFTTINPVDEYSQYNWPYDYFSIIEAIKMDSEILYNKRATNYPFSTDSTEGEGE